MGEGGGGGKRLFFFWRHFSYLVSSKGKDAMRTMEK